MNSESFARIKKNILSRLSFPPVALAEARKTADELNRRDISSEIDQLEQRYFYMLRMIAAGHIVEDYSSEMDDLQQSIRHILNKMERAVETPVSQSLYYTRLRFQDLRPEENVESLVSDYLAESERLRLDPSALTDTRCRASLERLSADIFNHIWVADCFKGDLSDLLKSLFEDESTPYYDRAIWLAALGLSALSQGGRGALELLYEAVDNKDRRLSVIAASWLFIALLLKDRSSYEDLLLQRLLDEKPDYAMAFIGNSFHQANASNHKDKIKPLNNEDIRNSLNNGSVSPEAFEMMETFVESQRRGDDVLLHTLGKMRFFPFFNELSNWFLPFHSSHSALADVVDGEGAVIAHTIDRAAPFCDSDKYAMLLSIVAAPEEMRSPMLEQAAIQFGAFGDIDEYIPSEGASPEESLNVLFNRYIKDLYRFFVYFGRIGEFPRFFALNVHFPLADFGPFMKLIENLPADDPLRVELAQSLYESGDYSKAYILLKDMELKDEASVLRFTAVLEAKGLSDKAARILEDYLSKNEPSEKIYRELIRLYVSAAHFDKALETAYSMDYTESENNREFRFLFAWIHALNGAFEEAEALIDDVEDNDSFTNAVRFGLIFWIAGKNVKGLDALKKAYKKFSAENKVTDPFDSFLIMVRSLIQELLRNPLNTDEVTARTQTLPEVLYYSIKGSRFGNI